MNTNRYDKMREVRLWIKEIGIPLAFFVGALLSNSEIRNGIKHGFYSFEDKIHELVKKFAKKT